MKCPNLFSGKIRKKKERDVYMSSSVNFILSRVLSVNSELVFERKYK